MFRTPPEKRQTGGLRTDGRGNADARKEAGRKRRGNEIRNQKRNGRAQKRDRKMEKKLGKIWKEECKYQNKYWKNRKTVKMQHNEKVGL